MISYRVIALLPMLTLSTFCLATDIWVSNWTGYTATNVIVRTPSWCYDAFFDPIAQGASQKQKVVMKGTATGIPCCFNSVEGQLQDKNGTKFNLGLPRNTANLPTTCDNSTLSLHLDGNGNVYLAGIKSHL